MLRHFPHEFPENLSFWKPLSRIRRTDDRTAPQPEKF
jgi:hypothetical protein